MEYRISIIKEVFPGFYNTDLDPGNIERYDDDGNLEEFTYEQYEQCTNNVCEYIVSLIKEHTSFKVIGWELKSPKYYNYENDTLWINIETTPERILYEFVHHEGMGEMVELIDWNEWREDQYHTAILEQLISYPLFEFKETFYEYIW